MSATRPILEAVAARLQTALPDVQVEIFPERPGDYQFIHPNGAVLVGYRGSKFRRPDGLGMIAQQRDVTLDLTVIGAGLHGDDGALAILDEVRLALTGYCPPDCQPCHLGEEAFLAEDAGAWMYSLTAHTEAQQVQRVAESNAPLFTAARYRREDGEHHTDLKRNP